MAGSESTNSMTKLDRYEVVFRNKKSGDRWSMMFDAEDFVHAVEQAEEEISTHYTIGPSWREFEEIIKIVKDYTP